MNVTKVSGSEVIYSPQSRDLVRTQNALPAYWSYPSGDANYTNNELTTFLLGPRGFKTYSTGYGTIHLEYFEEGLGASCHDRVDVFSYLGDFSGGWIHSRV